MSSLRRGAVATVAALATVALLAGCGETQADSKFGPVENVEYAPVNGINLDSTVVGVRNLYLLATDGAIPPRVRMTLTNTTNQGDALIGATAGRPAVTGRLLGGTAGTVPVAGGTIVTVGSDGGAQITFPGLQVKPGTWVPVTLLFRDGRAVTGDVLVQTPRSLYADGTVPQIPNATDNPVTEVLPSGEAVNPVVEGAEVEQGVTDQGQNNTED